MIFYPNCKQINGAVEKIDAIFKAQTVPYLSIFLLNTIFGSIEKILQETILQQSITMESNRATIISVSKALDAGVSVIVLSINGYISDNFGICSAWIFLATLGIVLFGISYLLNRKAVKVNGA